MICHRSRIVDLIEAHQVADDLLVQVCFPVTLDKVHEDVNGPSGLVAENLARSDVIGRHEVSRLVLLHFTQLGAGLLELPVENVDESFIEAH